MVPNREPARRLVLQRGAVVPVERAARRSGRARRRRAYDRHVQPELDATRRILRRLAPLLGAIAAVTAATGLVALLEHELGVPNAAAVYLVAVSAVAIATGTGGAVVAALLAVLVYDFLFTDPLHTLAVADPGELLNLLLLLFVAVVVGQLASLQRSRAEDAEAREREARDRKSTRLNSSH